MGVASSMEEEATNTANSITPELPPPEMMILIRWILYFMIELNFCWKYTTLHCFKICVHL